MSSVLNVTKVFAELKETVYFFFLLKKSAYILVDVSIYLMVIVTFAYFRRLIKSKCYYTRIRHSLTSPYLPFYLNRM